MYCSIQEAFEENIPAPAPKRAKKRREKERTVDPDRPANVPMQPAEYVGGGGNYTSLLSAVETDSSFFPTPTQDTQNSYMLDPDWTKQFDGPTLPPWIKERVAAKEAEIPLKPQVSSWMEGEPTLWQKVPASYTSQPPITYNLDERLQQFEAKIDSKLERMFAKLSELDRSHSESNHIEIILFIIGGLFVILMLDMLVKQGTRATMLLAAAGGARGGALELYKRYMA